MHSNRGRGRHIVNKREVYNQNNNCKRFRRNESYQNRGRSREINNRGARGSLATRGVGGLSMIGPVAQQNEYPGDNSSSFGNDYLLMCPSDDVYDAAYGNSPENKRDENSHLPPSAIAAISRDLAGHAMSSQNGIQYVNDNDIDSESGGFMSYVAHCNSRQPIIFANDCCLYPPDDENFNITNTSGSYSQEYCTILVSNVPKFLDDIMIESIFTRCGEIVFVNQNAEKQRETGEKSFNIRFRDINSTCNAVMYNNHFVHIGGPESMMTPDVLTKIKVEFVPDSDPIDPSSLLDSNLAFTEYNVSKLMSCLQSKSNMKESAETVINWLIAGECNSYNINTFLDLIASLNGFVPKIVNDNKDLNDAVSRYKGEILQKILLIKEKCNTLRSVFATFNIEKVWGVFNNAQRSFIHQCKEDSEKEFAVIESNLDDILGQMNEARRKLKESNVEDSLSSKHPLWSHDYQHGKKGPERDSAEKKIAKLNEDKLDLMSQLTDMTLVLKEKSRKINDLEIKLHKNDEKYGEVLKQRKKDLDLIRNLNKEITVLNKVCSVCKLGLPNSPADDNNIGQSRSSFKRRHSLSEDEGQFAHLFCGRGRSDLNVAEFGKFQKLPGEKSTIVKKEMDEESIIEENNKQFIVVDDVEDYCRGEQRLSANARNPPFENCLESENQNEDTKKICMKQPNRSNRRYRSNRKSPLTLINQESVQDDAEEEAVSLETANKEESSSLKSTAQPIDDYCALHIINENSKSELPNNSDISATTCDNESANQDTAKANKKTWELNDAALLSTISIALNSYMEGATVKDLLHYCRSNKFEVSESTITDMLAKFSIMFQCIYDKTNNCERWIFRGYDLLRSNKSLKEE